MKFPSKKYHVIYADPPWSYRDKAGKKGVHNKYNLISDSGICAIPVRDICEKDCWLFLWVTPPKLVEGLDTISSWGFEYKTVAFTWVKTNKKSGGVYMGMGSYTRANAELCLLGVRGNLKREEKGIRSAIISPKEEHSKKPDEVRERIVKLCGDVSRIELFARQQHRGWDSWGDDIK